MQDYYRDRAKEFFDDTVHLDLSEIHNRWLPFLPKCATILDVGCGSGRDALAFSKRGHRVIAFDASPELVALAKAHTGMNIYVSTIEEWFANSSLKFDGVWACASLLHLRPKALRKVFQSLQANVLTQNGFAYVSFKKGDCTRTDEHGRIFTDLVLQDLMELAKPLVVRDAWESDDCRPNRKDRWINAIIGRY
jgi:SAM-dependent methyltransferase